METEPKKGLSPIAWVGIGCAGLAILSVVVIGGLAFWGIGKAKEIVGDPAAAAELIIKMNPELDHVSTDRDAGTITVKNKTSGDVVTLNFDDIQQGRFSIHGEDGEEVFSVDATESTNGVTIRSGTEGEITIGGAASLDDVPSWVPVYPNTVKSTTAMNRTSPEGKASGMVTFEVTDDIATIAEHYKSVLEKDGYTVDERTVSTGGIASQVIITATHPDDGHSLSIMAGEAAGKRTLVINYGEK